MEKLQEYCTYLMGIIIIYQFWRNLCLSRENEVLEQSEEINKKLFNDNKFLAEALNERNKVLHLNDYKAELYLTQDECNQRGEHEVKELVKQEICFELGLKIYQELKPKLKQKTVEKDNRLYYEFSTEITVLDPR